MVDANDIIVGDVLFQGSVGRTDLPGGDTRTLMESIRDVILPLDDAVTVHTGHGPPTTVGRERRENFFIIEWGLAS
jgi:glyoxylase-like metal-dependent hydrolase (beta-lactamase superfamily II)